jgi:hypothetical protein
MKKQISRYVTYLVVGTLLAPMILSASGVSTQAYEEHAPKKADDSKCAKVIGIDGGDNSIAPEERDNNDDTESRTNDDDDKDDDDDDDDKERDNNDDTKSSSDDAVSGCFDVVIYCVSHFCDFNNIERIIDQKMAFTE